MMKRSAALNIVLCLSLLAGCVCAQQPVPKWDTISYAKWGFSLQLPAGAEKREIPDPPAETARDLYLVDGMACVVQVVPTPGEVLASTAIEQVIQSELKVSSKIGPARRWEQPSKQGDLFKGFSGSVELPAQDAVCAAAAQAIGGAKAVQCIAMAPLGDDSAPVLRISVYGPIDREKDVANTCKGVAAFVARGKTVPATPPVKPTVTPSAKPKPVPIPRPVPKPNPKPKPAPKPWPMLKAGLIELQGVVDSISADGKIVMMRVETVKVVNQPPVTLAPARSKKVLLKARLDWLKQGLVIRLIGKNSGEGKPIPADAVQEAAPPPGKPAPIRPPIVG